MLLSRLTAVDPQAAASINLHNVRRLIRALEVHHLTGVAWSKMRRQWPEPYRALVIGLTMPREQLYQRIDQRIDDMVRHGWTEEVRRLLDSGVTPRHSSMASVGYREMAACVAGDIALKEAIQNIKFGTHRVARHQYAWFRLSDARLRWLEVGEEVEAEGTNLVRAFVEEVS
jgi:tRNA dimethylallyltransferase